MAFSSTVLTIYVVQFVVLLSIVMPRNAATPKKKKKKSLRIHRFFNFNLQQNLFCPCLSLFEGKQLAHFFYFNSQLLPCRLGLCTIMATLAEKLEKIKSPKLQNQHHVSHSSVQKNLRK